MAPKIDLVIEATDLVGNKTTMTLAGVTHDQAPPAITQFFPKSDLLEGDDNQINDATRHPVFTLPEAVDSLSIVYDPSLGPRYCTRGSQMVFQRENIRKLLPIRSYTIGPIR